MGVWRGKNLFGIALLFYSFHLCTALYAAQPSDNVAMPKHDEIVNRLKQECPSVKHVVSNFFVGEELPVFTDLTKMVARVEMVHPDSEQVERDIARLTELIRMGVFYAKK